MTYIKYLFCTLAVLGVSIVISNCNDELIDYEVVNLEIAKPLTNIAGNPLRGKEIASSRDGNCLACHILPEVNKSFHGNVGPSLAGVGNRYNINQLRLRLVNPYILNPDTIMPAFYKVNGLKRVEEKFLGKPLLDAQEIEDVLSWLITLKMD